MKVNWGTGIVIAIVMFVSFIMYMVVTMISTNTDVVETDYYAQQIDYQATKEAKEKAAQFENEISIIETKDTINIIFPNEANLENIESGEIHFYRPENADLDKKFKMNAAIGNTQKIPAELLTAGNYIVKIRWQDAKDIYVVEKRTSIEQWN